MELWESIVNYEGLYEVSNLGRVKGLIRNKVLSPKVNCRTGYVEVTLYKNGVGKTHRVHRLVALAFIPCADLSLEINHINENKLDNTVENLEWCDRNYNTHYGNRIKLSVGDVHQIRLLREQGYSIQELSMLFDVSISQIYKVLGNKQWR